MKKTLLRSLLVAAAMFTGICAQAQEDVTNQYLLNADLSTDPAWENNGWTLGDNWRQDYQQGYDSNHVNVVEFYAGWGGLERTYYSMSQTVSLPAGDYRIAVNAFYRQGDSGNGTNNDKAWIFAGENKQNVYALTQQSELWGYDGSSDLWKASNAFAKGKYSNEFDFTLEEDASIDLGFEGTFDEARCWVILGPVKLYKYSLEDYLVDYRAKVAEATAMYDKPMNAEILAALKAAVVEESTFTISKQVTAAILTLTEAINAAKASIAAYEKLDAALTKGEAFLATCVEYGAPESCKNDLNELRAAYENGTIADADIDATIALIQPIMLAAAKQQTKAGADMTPLLVNPDYEQDEYGWTVEATEGSGPSGRQGNVRPGGSADNHCYEAWNNSNFDIYQIVEDVPFGVYEISVQGFYRYSRDDNAWNAYIGQTVEYVKPAGVPVYVYLNDNPTNFTNVYGDPKQITDETFYSTGSNDYSYHQKDGTTYYYPNGMASAAIAFSDGMYTQSAYGLVAFEGDKLRLGVKGSSTQAGDSWVIWDNFKLTYKGFDPEVIKPVLEVAVDEVESTYIGLLMGKTEYASFTNALAKAEEAIKNNDGEKMFEALRELYAAKDPALASKDLFLAQEVAADTARLAQAIRDVAEAKMANKTRANANDLLYGLQNNLIYENDQIDQLKQDVTDMIDALNNSVALYADMNSQASTLRNDIATVREQLPQLKVLTEAEALCDEADGYYANGTLDDENVPAFIESMKKMRQKLLEFLVNYTLMYSALQDLSNAINEGKTAGLSADLINEAQAIYDAALAAYNAGEMGRGDMADEALKVTDETNKLRDAITDLTTGINGVKTQATDGPAYNMGGQKVKNQKGLIIKNQKKVVVK